MIRRLGSLSVTAQALIAAALLFALYVAVSLGMYRNYLSGAYDLGIFDQAVHSYAHGHWPYSLIKGPHYSVLGDHFSPILVLIVPLYWVFPHAQTLLVLQAALIAISVVPIYRWSARELGSRAASILAFGYGTFWGIGAAVSFDFHEIAFAVPLLAFSLTALVDRRFRAAVLWALPLVLVKEDLGVTVAAIGLVVLLRGGGRWAWFVVVFGLAATAVEMLVLIPMANPDGYAYAVQLGSSNGAGSAAPGQATKPPPMYLRPFWPPIKWGTTALLLAPSLGLVLRSCIVLVAVPTMAWRFMGANWHYWYPTYHYSAVLGPILFVAFIEVLVRLDPAKRWRIVVASGLVSVALFPVSGLRNFFTPVVWSTSAHAQAAQRVTGLVPAGAHVAAEVRLVPHLTDRATVAVFPNLSGPLITSDVRYVLIDAPNISNAPNPPARTKEAIAELPRLGFYLVADDHGVQLWER